DIGPWSHTPPGGHNLEAVGAGLELASGGDAHFRFAVRFEAQKMAVSACNRDRRSRRQDARACDLALGNRVTQAERHASSATEIAHGWNPRPQRLSGLGDTPSQQ